MAVETKSIIDDKEIKAKSLTILEFLEDNNCINIPRYQREYSWKKENIKTLLNDIHKDYYLGNIISYKDSNVSEIIDGQQRIITTFLILITIRNITTNANLKNDIEKIIYHNDECKLKLKDRIGSTGRNILNFILDDEDNIPDLVKEYNEIQNYNFIKKTIKPMDLELIYNNLINSLVVEISFTKNISDAHEMFVNVNTKGKPLTEIEILKSQLFKYLLSRPNSDFYKEKWQEMLNSIPKKEYSTYVSDSYLQYLFINSNPDDTIKTSGTVKENFMFLLKIIDNKQKALNIFYLMTDSGLDNIYYPYCAVKNHNLTLLKDNYYSNLTTSITRLDSLWKMFGEFGFEQSDVLFVSLFRNKETFVNNHTNYLYTFMLYIFLYEISRSIIGTSPAQYSNSFRQLARNVCNENDPSKIKQILKEYIINRKIDTDTLKICLNESDRFSKNYKTARFIIMLVDNNLNCNLTTEHFIYQKTTDSDDKKYINYLGNLIPVIKDKYKDKPVFEKLELYKNDALSDISIKRFLETGIDNINYQQKIVERTAEITDKFIEMIDKSYEELTRR